MVALRTSVFVSESNEVEPNKRVCVKYESLNSNSLESMLFKVLRRVSLTMKYRTVEKKMGGRFSTRTTTTKWI